MVAAIIIDLLIDALKDISKATVGTYYEVSRTIYDENQSMQILRKTLDKAVNCRQDQCRKGGLVDAQQVKSASTIFNSQSQGGTDTMKIYNINTAGKFITIVLVESQPTKVYYNVTDGKNVLKDEYVSPTELTKRLIDEKVLEDPKRAEKAFRL